MRLHLATLAPLALAACQMASPDPAIPDGFTLLETDIAPLEQANLCTALGGQGQQPALRILHSPVEGVPLRVRMYDMHSDGTVTEHNTVTVTTSRSGETFADAGFLPPCNRSGGARNSSYRFDVRAGGETATQLWGDYDSTAGRIVPAG